MLANYTAMPPKGLSPAGLIVRRDANILSELLKNQPKQHHDTEAKTLRTTFTFYQDSLIEAQKDSNKHLQHCEESKDLFLNAKATAALISDQHATICATVTSLTRQLLGISQPRLELPQRIALVRQLSDAVVEHDAVVEQMWTMELEVENFRRSYDDHWRETKDCNESVQRLLDEYEVLKSEVEDVMSLLRRLLDDNKKCENGAEFEEAVKQLSQGAN